MPIERYKRPIRLTLPPEVGSQLEKMARQREMTVDAMVGELVLLGLVSLSYPKPEPIDALRGDYTKEDFSV